MSKQKTEIIIISPKGENKMPWHSKAYREQRAKELSELVLIQGHSKCKIHWNGININVGEFLSSFVVSGYGIPGKNQIEKYKFENDLTQKVQELVVEDAFDPLHSAHIRKNSLLIAKLGSSFRWYRDTESPALEGGFLFYFTKPQVEIIRKTGISYVLLEGGKNEQ